MPKTRTGSRSPPLVSVAGRHSPLTRAAVVRAAETVLRAERRGAVLSIAFVGRDRMRTLHRRWKGEDRVTDVLAFRLPTPGGWPLLAGDVYVCPWQAARAAREHGVPLREELLRLVIHGVLHVLGRDHPDGPERVRSPMWRRQEQMVRRVR